MIVVAERPKIDRILLLSPSFPPTLGGIERTAGELAANLSKDHETIVVAGQPAIENPHQSRHGRAELHWTRNNPPYGRRATIFLNLHAIRVGVVRRPDLVLCLHIRAMPAARVIQRRAGARVVLVVHAKEMTEQPALARAAMTWADGIIAVSEFSRYLAVDAGAPQHRIKVINPGVTIPVGEVIPVSDREGPTIVLAVARMVDRHKGHDLLIDALKLLRGDGDKVRAVLVGDGPLRAELERLATDRGVRDLVTFTGGVDDHRLRQELRRAHIFCLPTRLPGNGAAGEGFGISFIEAGAYGLPVVAGRVPGVVDAVEDGVTGLLVPPNDPAAVATAIRRISTDARLAASLGEAGRQRAGQLAWPKVVARYLDWFECIVVLPRQRRRLDSRLGWLIDLLMGPRSGR